MNHSSNWFATIKEAHITPSVVQQRYLYCQFKRYARHEGFGGSDPFHPAQHLDRVEHEQTTATEDKYETIGHRFIGGEF